MGEPVSQRRRRLRRRLAAGIGGRGRRRRAVRRAREFRGKLPYSWPKRADQTPLNVGDAGYDPLFAYGFGLTTRDNGELAPLSEARDGAGGDRNTLFARGKATGGRRLLLGPAGQRSSPTPAPS